MNEKKFKSLLLENYDHDKNIYRLYAPGFVGGPMAHPNKSKMADL